MPIIYFHGFASKGGGPKFDMLEARFKERGIEVISPDLPIDPAQVPNAIGHIMRDLIRQEPIKYTLSKRALIEGERAEPYVFMGSSLGGFYAAFCAGIWGVQAVLINPSFKPSGLRRLVGKMTNFVDGSVFDWKNEYCDTLQSMEETIEIGGNSLHLFVTKDDYIVPMEETIAQAPHHAWLQVFEDGGHMQLQHFPEVVDYVDSTFFGATGVQTLVEPVLDEKTGT